MRCVSRGERGIKTGGLCASVRDPRATTEIGIDIAHHTSKHVDGFMSAGVETVITVCGNADQACPVFPERVNRHHFPFDDAANAKGGEDEQMAVFRRVRDEIRAVFGAYATGRLDESRAFRA